MPPMPADSRAGGTARPSCRVKHPTPNLQKLEASLANSPLQGLGRRPQWSAKLRKTPILPKLECHMESTMWARPKAGMSFKFNKWGSTSKARMTSFLVEMCMETANIQPGQDRRATSNRQDGRSTSHLSRRLADLGTFPFSCSLALPMSVCGSPDGQNPSQSYSGMGNKRALRCVI